MDMTNEQRKEYHRRKHKEYRDRNREEYRAKCKNGLEKFLDKVGKEEYLKQKRASHSPLNNLIKSGKVIKEECYFCGENKTEGHHHDYSKPLDVTWLCKRCHGKLHTLLRLHNVILNN